MIDLAKLYKEETGDNLLEDMKENRCYVYKDSHLNDFLLGFEFDNNTKDLVAKAEKLLDPFIGEEYDIDEDDDIFMKVLVKVNTTNNIDYYFIMKLNINVDFETSARGYAATYYEPEDYIHTFTSYKINSFAVESIQLLEDFIN